jgi:hypothetical protein
MPRISWFFGIGIYMHVGDHPPPHFHAEYAGKWGVFAISPPRQMAGALPPRVARLVLEWTRAHVPELLANWSLAQAGGPLRDIEPLE